MFISDVEFLSTDEYSIDKARQENLLFELKEKNWTIIRFYITYAENRLQLGNLEKENWLGRIINGKKVLFSTDMLEKKTTLTFGADVASGIISILGKEETLGETYHITQELVSTWKEIWEMYKRFLTDYIRIEPEILFSDLETYKTFFSNGKYQIQYDRLYNRVFDNSKIKKYIDVSNFKTPEEGIELSIKQFFNNNVKLLPFSWGQVARIDRITHDLYTLNQINGLNNKIKYYLRRMGI